MALVAFYLEKNFLNETQVNMTRVEFAFLEKNCTIEHGPNWPCSLNLKKQNLQHYVLTKSLFFKKAPNLQKEQVFTTEGIMGLIKYSL